MRITGQLLLMVVLAAVGCSDSFEPAADAPQGRDGIDVGDPCFTDEDCGVCERCHFTQICRKIRDGCKGADICEDGVVVDTCESPQTCCEKPQGVGCYNYCEFCQGDIMYQSIGDVLTDCCKAFGETCDEYDWSIGCGGVCTNKEQAAQSGGEARSCAPAPQPE